MNLQWLKIYLDVIETGSFAGAGRRQHITQPAVSMAVASLEKQVGQTLLVRTPGQRARVSPTREGVIFQDFAKNVIDSYNKMKIQMLQDKEFEPFSVATSPTPGSVILPVLLKAFKNDFPQSSCKVRTHSGKEIIHRLKHKEFDMAITGIPVDDPEVVTERFFFDPMELICPTAMKLNDAITLQHLKRLPLIIRNLGCNTTNIIEESLSKVGLTLSDMNVVMQVYGNADVFNAVALDSGVGFVTRSLLSTIDDNDKVRIVQVKKLKIERYLHLVRLKHSPFSPTLKLFWEYAKEDQWRQGRFAYNTINW